MPSPVDESELRWPWDRPISVLTVLLNFGLIAAAILLVAYGSQWMESYPFLAKRIEQLRVVAIAAIVALPGVVILRNARRGNIRGNSVRVSRDQFPEIYGILERQCQKLGVTKLPELYLSDASDESHAFSAWSRNYIVLGTDYLGPVQESLGTIEFFLGRQIGAMRLGYAKWWNELLMWYVLKLPLISLPVRKARVLSQDRYGAFLAGGSIRPLIVLVTGRLLSRAVNVDGYLDQVGKYGGLWDRVGAWTAKAPPLARRVKALQEAGLLREEPEGSASVHTVSDAVRGS